MVSKKKKLDIGSTELVTIKPITDTQTKVFDASKNDKNLFLYGMAATGKTFISIYLALKEV